MSLSNALQTLMITEAGSSSSVSANAISSLYTSILKRDVDAGGLTAWLSAAESGSTLAEIRAKIVASSEAGAVIAPLVRLYQAAFGRIPDQAGLDNWADQLRAGTPFLEVAKGFVGSAEFEARYPSASSGNLTAFVTALYNQTLGRAPDAAGLSYWINSGFSTAQILVGFSESQEFHDRSQAKVATFLSATGQGNSPSTSYSLFQLGAASELKGDIIDGKIAGATVGIDVNGDGVIGPDEPTVITDAFGDFAFPDGTPLGGLIASGGKDISTGLAFTGKLTAPVGSLVVTPLTTLIKQLADSDTDPAKSDGQKVAEAQALLKTMLGLSGISADLTKVDHVVEATEGDASGTDGLSDFEALQLYATATKLINIVSQGVAAIVGASPSTDPAAAADAVFAALAKAFSLQPAGTVVNLGSTTSDAGDLLSNALKDAASRLLDGAALEIVEQVADSAARIIAAANTEIDNAVDALSTGEPVNPNDPNSGDANTLDALVRIVQTQKFVQGDAADDLKDASSSGNPDGAAATLADSIASGDGSGFANQDLIDDQNIGDVSGDGIDDDGVDGTTNPGTGGGGGGGGGGVVTPPPGPVAVLDAATGTVTLTDVTTAVASVSGTTIVFTSKSDGRASTFDLSTIKVIDLSGRLLELTGATVDSLFKDVNSGQIDIVGFANSGKMDITSVDFGDIRNEKVKSPNVWLSDRSSTSPKIGGFTFSELANKKSILPDGLTVNGQVSGAFKAWWDSFDDMYAAGDNYYNTLINTQFVYLGNDYVDYLRNGGSALLEIVKTSGDYITRQQSLHDNLLGNLGDTVIKDRFKLDDPRTDESKLFGARPYVDGNKKSLTAFENAKHWDLDVTKHDQISITRNDKDWLIVRNGQLDDVARDGGNMIAGTGIPADGFSIVRNSAADLELGLRIRDRDSASAPNDTDNTTATVTTYTIAAGASSNSGNRSNLQFDFSFATNISGNNQETSLDDYVLLLRYDIDPGKTVAFVTATLDAENLKNMKIVEAPSGFETLVGQLLVTDNNSGGADLGANVLRYASQNSQNYAFAFFTGLIDRFDNGKSDNSWSALDSSHKGTFNIILEAQDKGGTVLGINEAIVNLI